MSQIQITPTLLRKLCREQQLYTTPELNDKIYLHYKGFRKIENLEAYTGLRVIYLEGNALTKIEGLDALTDLRCLYLQENAIENVENLDKLTQLDTLQLSHNMLTSVAAGSLVALTKLHTLVLAHNNIKDVEAIKSITECPSIGVLDLQDNQISDPSLLDVLRQMPALKVLYLKGNAVTGNIKNYRKTVISSLKQLTYLDDRPVFDDERKLAEAWAIGGTEGEKKERERLTQEKQARETRNFESFERIVQSARRAGVKSVADIFVGEDDVPNEPESDITVQDGKALVSITAMDRKMPELEEVAPLTKTGVPADAIPAPKRSEFVPRPTRHVSLFMRDEQQQPSIVLQTTASRPAPSKALIELIDSDDEDDAGELM